MDEKIVKRLAPNMHRSILRPRHFIASLLLCALCAAPLQAASAKTLCIITGENEYKTAESLAEFAEKEISPRGLKVTYVAAPSMEGATDFSNYEAIKEADVILVSVRRRTPPKPMMDLIRAHVAAGKAVVGIRTASHAFDAKPADAEHAAWATFDDDVLGGDYQNHYGAKPGVQTIVAIEPANASHPVLTGVTPAEFPVTSSLYKYPKMAETVTVLMRGSFEGQSQPVAWVNTAQNRRVFYTSLGNTNDFQLPAFRRLLSNGILWAARETIPAADAKPVPASAPKKSAGLAAPRNPLDLPQEAASQPLSPAESAHHFQVAEDLEWEQVLAEPIITQPVFLNFDERGRMWVVEYRQYPSPAGLTITSHDSVWRAVYDKVPPPPPHHFKGKDRITIHEDTDGDGTFDKHTTFVDGLNIATSVERGRGGVWVLNPPYLLFYPDANNDDIPDGDPEVRLAGFGLEDTHSVANSLRWGPDGWLYGAQGSTVTANIQVFGSDGRPMNGKPIYSQGQNIWRYHPEKRVYEVFAEGGGNAFGCEIDSKGRIFSGHNGGDTRGFHYVQGGYLQKGFEKHGPLSNPYAFGYFAAMPHHSVPRFTHNFLIYEADAFPAHYIGKLFGVEPIQGRIVESEILPDKSSFRTRDLSRPLSSDDRWFRPVDIKLGPDGALYVCDWYDQQVNHYRNHEGKMDASNGRVYRLKSKGSKPARQPDLTRSSTAQLVSLLDSPNRWKRQTALRVLADRQDPALASSLLPAMEKASGQGALELLWALHLCGGLTDEAALKALSHPDPFVRLWTIRLLADERNVSTQIASKFIQIAQSESNLEARNQIAASARRLPARECLAILRPLLSHDEDAGDNRMPALIWWAIESQCENSREEVLALFSDRALWQRPIVRSYLLERVMRRYAQAGTRRDLLACARLLELAPGPEETKALMNGFEAGVKGRSLSGWPEELVRALAKGGGSLSLDVRRGDKEAQARALRLVADDGAERKQRLELLSALSEIKVAGAAPVLTKAFEKMRADESLRQAVLAALRQYDDAEIASAILAQYSNLGRETLATAQTMLASRPAWSLELAKAVERRQINSQSVPLNVVRKIKQYRDPALRKLADELWPNAGVSTTAAMEEKIHALAKNIRVGTGDPYNGRTLFQNTCGSCHKLFSQGGEIGPDLTTYKRDDLDTMLLSIINPNAEIREGYENYSVELKDGESLSGFIAEQDDQVVVLRGLDNQNLTLNRRQIADLKPAGMSLMPEGLLDGFNEQQVLDLFAYLRSTQPLVGSR